MSSLVRSDWGRAHKRAALAFVITASLSLLAGCSSSESGEVQLPSKNAALWVMPTDSYLPNEETAETVEYAHLLMDTECLTEAGYPLSPPFRDPSTSWESETWNTVGTRLFTKAIASKYGYHLAPSAEANETQWDAFYQTPLSDSAKGALATCRESRDVQIPDILGTRNQLVMLLTAAEEEARQAEEVVEAASKWRQCMAPLGVADLPERPSGLPTDSQRSDFDLNDGDLTAAPSATEIAQATFDAECRDTSGYGRALYNATFDANAKVLEENLSAFENSRVQSKEALEIARKAIAERAAR